CGSTCTEAEPIARSRPPQRNMNGLCIGEYRGRGVVLVKRFKDHHLIAGVDRRHHCRDHALGRAAGYRDLGLGVDVEPKEPLRLLCDHITNDLTSPDYLVLIVVRGYHL